MHLWQNHFYSEVHLPSFFKLLIQYDADTQLWFPTFLFFVHQWSPKWRGPGPNTQQILNLLCKNHFYVALRKTNKAVTCIAALQQRCIIRSQQWFSNRDPWPLTNLLYIQQKIQQLCASPALAFKQSFSWACDPDISLQLSLQLNSTLVSLMSPHGCNILLFFFLRAGSTRRSWQRPLWWAPSAFCVAVNKLDGLLPECTDHWLMQGKPCVQRLVLFLLKGSEFIHIHLRLI